MPSTRALAQHAIPVMTRPVEVLLGSTGDQDEVREDLAKICERLGPRAVLAAWTYLGGACIVLVHRQRGITKPEASLEQLADLVRENWRPIVGALDYDDGFSTAEEVFQRDVWDLPTMALLAGHPPEMIPDTLHRLVEACSAVSAGASAVAARQVADLASQQFSDELAETLVLRVLLPQVAMGGDMAEAFRQVRDLAVSLAQKSLTPDGTNE